MGYDLERFHGEVDEELKCLICAGVLENPLQGSAREHVFCRACIKEWLLSRISLCPLDMKELKADKLRALPKILQDSLSRLCIACDNAANGCTFVVELDDLNDHLKECEYGPKQPLPCEKNCGFRGSEDELKYHNCVSELRKMILRQQQKTDEQMNKMKRELQLIKRAYPPEDDAIDINDAAKNPRLTNCRNDMINM